jgi:hypothetical protein
VITPKFLLSVSVGLLEGVRHSDSILVQSQSKNSLLHVRSATESSHSTLPRTSNVVHIPAACNQRQDMTVTDRGETESPAVKVVDFGPFLNGSDKRGVAEALVKSFRTTGFVYLTNHPMPQEKIKAMFELVGFPRQHYSVFLYSHS